MQLISEFFVSFLGAAAGGSVTAIAFFFRRSEESKQKYRQVLFELLRIYRTLIVTKEFTADKYVKAFSNVLSELGNQELCHNTQAQNMLMAFVAPQIEDFISQIGCVSEESYAETVRLIAPINPVLAHSLRANVILKNALSTIKEQSINYLNNLQTEPNVAGTALPFVEEELIDHILKDLRQDIINIARLAGVMDYIRINRWLKNGAVSIEEIIRPLAAQLMLRLKDVELKRS